MMAELPIRHLWERGSRVAMESLIGSTLDKEWERMMADAREIGLTVENVRNFLRKKAVHKEFNVDENSENVS